MKRISIYIILLSGFLVSCEDFLEKLPLDSISSFDYWTAPRDLELYVNQFYTSFPTYPFRGTIYWNDDNSDNGLTNPYNTRLAGYMTVPSSGGSWSFTNIRSVNYFLSNYKNVESDWENIRQYAGEGHFFRAYFYFELLCNYGDVPWINRPLNTDDEELLYGPRVARNIIADSIIADLDKAISYLKPKASAPKDRVNSEVALLFKSRVCLFEGTWEKYHASDEFKVSGSDGTKYLTLASQAAKKLIDDAQFSISYNGNPGIDYGSMFIQTNLDNNPEVMLYRSFNEELELYHYSQQMLVWPQEHAIAKSIVDDYLCTDGLPISTSPLYKGDLGLKNVVANRDLRLAQCIWVTGDPLKIVGTDTVSKFTLPYIDKSGGERDYSGYMIKKGLDPHTINYNSKCEIAAILFRYAEALLNYTEAQAELGSITQSDIDLTINVLRKRAGVAQLSLNNIVSDPNWQFPTLSPIINEVRRERRVELAFEGFRLDDLLRWGAHELIVGKNPKGIKFNQSDFPLLVIGQDVYVDANGYIDPYQKSLPAGYGFNPNRDYLLPIPALELTLNENLGQNPGW